MEIAPGDSEKTSRRLAPMVTRIPGSASHRCPESVLPATRHSDRSERQKGRSVRPASIAGRERRPGGQARSGISIPPARSGWASHAPGSSSERGAGECRSGEGRPGQETELPDFFVPRCRLRSWRGQGLRHACPPIFLQACPHECVANKRRRRESRCESGTGVKKSNDLPLRSIRPTDCDAARNNRQYDLAIFMLQDG